MNTLTCGFIGLGLIGGSIAKALKANIPSIRIICYDINPETLKEAQNDLVVDEAFDSINEAFLACDYIFLCAPVSHNDTNLRKVTKYLSSNCILTDVGSVKSTIHEHIQGTPFSKQFIGGHPMAGSERIGYSNSKALLLQNAYFVLTPTKEVAYDKIMAYQNLVKKIGAIPLVLDYNEHDYITAAISHLPHIIAASLVNLVRESDGEEGLMKMMAAGGFKDITRIASSSPVMWQQICLTNTENISTLLSRYINDLILMKDTLDTGNSEELYQFFNTARNYRDSFINASSGPIKRVYALTVDVADEPGALASIATMLALNSISIKNIGIVHNREYAEGAMRIEFYEESAVDSAEKLLTKKSYNVYKRTL